MGMQHFSNVLRDIPTEALVNELQRRLENMQKLRRELNRYANQVAEKGKDVVFKTCLSSAYSAPQR